MKEGSYSCEQCCGRVVRRRRSSTVVHQRGPSCQVTVVVIREVHHALRGLGARVGLVGRRGRDVSELLSPAYYSLSVSVCPFYYQGRAAALREGLELRYNLLMQ